MCIRDSYRKPLLLTLLGLLATVFIVQVSVTAACLTLDHGDMTRMTLKVTNQLIMSLGIVEEEYRAIFFHISEERLNVIN